MTKLPENKWHMALIAAVAIGAAFYVWLELSDNTLPDELDYRLAEGRFSGKQSYLPWRSAPTNMSAEQRRQWLRVAQKVRDKKPLDATSLNELGRIAVMQDDFEQAEAHFQLAHMLRTEAIEHRNDWVVSLLELGRNDKIIIMEALAQIQPLLPLKEERPEVFYNLGLIYESLGLLQLANHHWQAFLEAHPQDPWSEEVRARLDQLQDPSFKGEIAWEQLPLIEALSLGEALDWAITIKDGALDGRAFFWEVCLKGWIHFYHQGLTVLADRCVALGKTIAETLFETEQDAWYQEVCQALTPAHGPAFQKWLAAFELYQERDYNGAVTALTTLNENLPPVAQVWHCYHLALSYFQIKDFDRAAELLHQLLQDLERQSYPFLEAQSSRLLGLIFGNNGDFYTYLEHSLHAMHLSSDFRYADHRLRNRLNCAEAYRLLGDFQRAFEIYLAMLSESRPRSHAGTIRWVTGAIAEILSVRQRWELAQYFQDEAVLTSRSQGKASSLAQTLRRRAIISLEAGQVEQVEADLNEVELLLPKIQTPATRENLEAEMALVKGQYLIPRDAEMALKLLKQGYDALDREMAYARLPEVDLLMGRLLQEAGALEQAEATFRRGLQWVESSREDIVDAGLKIQYQDLSISLHHALAALFTKKDEPAKALMAVEAGRARLLDDQLDKNHSDFAEQEGPFLEALKQQIPENASLIAFFLGKTTIWFWVFTKAEMTFGKLALDRHALEQMLQELERRLAHSNALLDPMPLLEKLSAELLNPVKAKVSLNKHVIILPDQALWQMPFSALRDEGGFFLKQHTVTLTPSLKHLRYSRQMSTSVKEDSQGHLVAIGDPAFKPQLFRRKPRLPQAGEEARSLQGYRQKTLLLGREASVEAAMEAMKTADVIHFAGHVELNADLPLKSCLLMAPHGESSGVLTVEEVLKQQFDRPKLLILAGCESGKTGGSPSESGGDLARAFLAAGIPSVIGTLQSISDKANLPFAKELHQNITQGMSPAEALRHAQLEMIQRDSDVFGLHRVWWKYQVFGSP